MFDRTDSVTTRVAGRYAGALVAVLVLGLTASGPAAAQGSSGGAQGYEADRALCISGLTHQERQDCLREAAAARQAARRGDLRDTGDEEEYRRNALRRCERLPEQFRADCVARIRGEGTMTEGSVEGGGIYRERRELIPVPDPARNPPARPARPPSGDGAAG